MALGVNYGAFSAAFSASLAGLLWRDIFGQQANHCPEERLCDSQFADHCHFHDGWVCGADWGHVDHERGDAIGMSRFGGGLHATAFCDGL
jgi:hypothetical protein